MIKLRIIPIILEEGDKTYIYIRVLQSCLPSICIYAQTFKILF